MRQLNVPGTVLVAQRWSPLVIDTTPISWFYGWGSDSLGKNLQSWDSFFLSMYLLQKA